MNTAEILSLISTICYILAGVSLALAAFFWFFFKIPTVIGDLSGRTAKKTIAKMRRANEHSGNKSFRPSTVNVQRGKLTDVMLQERQQKAVSNIDSRPETGLLEDNKAQPVDNQQTELLDSTQPAADPNETMPLDSNETELLATPDPLVPGPATPAVPAASAVPEDDEKTMPLNSNETELLSEPAAAPMPVDKDATALLNPMPSINPGTKHLTLLEQVILIHTNEVI